MTKFRVGKDSNIICPPCPQNTPCLNQLTETAQFNVGDQVTAIYETECVGTTPGYIFIIYLDTDLNGSWIEVDRFVPPANSPTAVFYTSKPMAQGSYKFTFGPNEIPFTVGTDCTSSILVLAGIVVVIGMIGTYAISQNK